MNRNQIRFLLFVFFIAFSFFIAWTGSIFTESSVNSWYPTLKKAFWNPPPYVFAPVWTILYFMIALSGWFVSLEREKRKALPFTIYFLQLLLNLFWSFFFFYLRNPLLAFFDICFLLAIIIWNIILFWPISKKGAFCLVPYGFWVVYASSLNWMIVYLNH